MIYFTQLWKLYYTDLYSDPATYVPWYPIFGNHDYYVGGNPQAQIDYYKQHMDTRWTFPDYQYTQKWTIPGSTKTLEIVFINTVELCPDAEVGPNAIPWPSPPENYTELDKLIQQPVLQWIENALAASTADVLLVAGHYDVYTNTEGDSMKPEALCLQKVLAPLLKKYRVAAYMNGHEHNFEHHFIDGMHYLTVGHGCDQNDPLAPGTPPGLLYNKTIGGFAIMHVSDKLLNFSFIDENKEFLYGAHIANPRSNSDHTRHLRGSTKGCCDKETEL